MKANKISISYQYFLSILVVVLVSAICFGLSAYIGYRTIALILLVTVSLIAMFFDIVPVMVAAISSALIWDYFFIPPHFTLSIGSGEDTLMLLMYFIIALVNAVLTYKIRQVEKKAMLEEGKANTIKLYNTLLNSLSHELRTPIATIVGSSDNLLTNSKNLSDSNKSELINEISKASFRLNQQVENLLNMSRLESGVIKPHANWCDINELIYSAVNKLESELINHTVTVNVPEKFPLFKIDFGLMERALFNLINNASIYTPAKSLITISAVQRERLSKGKDELETVSNELIITVEDNGKGFPADEVQHVFEKFYRLKDSKTGGIGLGLSIVKGFVEAHNGRVSLENKQNGGAQFTIEIPAEVSYISNLKNE